MHILRVAIADDSEIIRNRMAEKISRLDGCTVLWQASDVPSTIEAMNSSSPDVLLLDIRMPSGSGIDVLKEMRNKHPETVVIMLTNFSMGIFRRCCMREGADYFFDKTTEFEKVIGVIQTLKYKNQKREQSL